MVIKRKKKYIKELLGTTPPPTPQKRNYKNTFCKHDFKGFAWFALQPKGRFTHSMPFPCRADAVPLPCRATKGLEYVFPIWFIQRGRVWFTLAMPCSDHAVFLKATAQHGRLSTAVLCCGLEKNGMVGAWHGLGMASVNQTRPHCVNQIGKTQSKPLAARHGRDMDTAWYVWIGLRVFTN